VLGTNPPVLFGDKPVREIALGDIESWRDARRDIGRSPVTTNHDPKLLRKMFNWGIRKGYVERTPFKIETEPAITLDPGTPRNKRFEESRNGARAAVAQRRFSPTSRCVGLRHDAHHSKPRIGGRPPWRLRGCGVTDLAYS
jgi:hypothetical protein